MLSRDTRERLKSFRRIRRSYYAFWLLVLLTLISSIAELIANNRPIILSYQGQLFFPVLFTYNGQDFGDASPVEPQYKSLQLGANDWALWPMLHWGDNETNEALSSYPAPPSAENLLGTDDRGRDILTRLIYGYRVSFLFGIVNLLLALVLGVLIGGSQGYLGGMVDLFGQRFVEIWSALPYLYVLILIVNIFEPGIWVLIAVSAVFVWIRLSYYVRAEFLKVRRLDFIVAAKALGARHSRVIMKHIFPNALTPIVTFAPFIVSVAITNLAVLDYLGLGVPPPTASLGELLRQGRTNFITAWWLAVFPFGVLVTLTASLYFIGEGLREAFDPRR